MVGIYHGPSKSADVNNVFAFRDEMVLLKKKGINFKGKMVRVTISGMRVTPQQRHLS